MGYLFCHRFMGSHRTLSLGFRRFSQIWTPESRDATEKPKAKTLTPKTGETSENSLLNQIVGRIRFDGPMTVSQYMQEIMNHPKEGYYMNRDAFGTKGDFITSPEISQMFGECLGIWILHEWNKMGSPLPLQIVELGPGRGTLMQDILRTFQKIVPESLNQIGIHLVESSPYLRHMQEAVLCGSLDGIQKTGEQTASTKFGTTIEWHSDLDQVPRECFSIFVANEFFDALPVHKFVRVKCDESGQQEESGEKIESNEKIWREVLVDIYDDLSGQTKLRLVRSRHRTPASRLLTDEAEFYEENESAEISPKSGLVVQEMSNRIAEFGGAALIADYGHDGLPTHGDTLRAFKNHKLHDPLVSPGSADVTVDVDFKYLKRRASDATLTYGPVTQKDFLLQLGIEARRTTLLKHNPDDENVRNQIESAYNYLLSSDKMGLRFKFFSIFPKTMATIHTRFPPVGFTQQKL